MPSLPGVQHRRAVKAFELAGFWIVREGKHISMTDGKYSISAYLTDRVFLLLWRSQVTPPLFMIGHVLKIIKFICAEHTTRLCHRRVVLLPLISPSFP
jgi:hypothetical protein